MTMTVQLKVLINNARREYLATLREGAAQIEALVAEVQFGLSEARTYRELEEIAHRQAGTALTLGFVTLGLAAQAVDLALQKGIEDAQLVAVLAHWTQVLAEVVGPTNI